MLLSWLWRIIDQLKTPISKGLLKDKIWQSQKANFLLISPPSVSISLAQFGANSATANSDLGLEATVNVPTGGLLSFRWATSGQTLNSNGFLIDPIDNGFGQNFQLSFNQPLLRGAGINVNKASVDIARLTEQVNILDLKATLINTITDAIIAYRELLRAQERLKIARISLKSAQDFWKLPVF
jgi:outer membrane protein TolC